MANNTGVFFNVNDNDGIPLVGVSTNGNVSLTPFYGNTGIGITNPVSSLDVDGPIISRSGAFVVSTFSSGGSEASWANPISVSNVDHIWHNDGLPGVGNTWGLGGEWNFVSDSTYKADGNSWIRAGGFANTTQMLGASYPLQISGNSYISGSLGIGTTNPTAKLDVVGNINTTGIITASSFVGTTEVPFIQKGGRNLTLNSETTFAPLFVGDGFLPTPITISLSSGTYEISFLIKVNRGTIETPSASLIMRLLNTAGLGLTPPYGYISGKISGKSPGSTSFDNLITSSNIESEIVLTNSASIPGEYIAHFSGIMHILQNNFIIGPQYRFSNITNTGATCASSNYMSIKKISNTELSNSYQGGWTI